MEGSHTTCKREGEEIGRKRGKERERERGGRRRERRGGEGERRRSEVTYCVIERKKFQKKGMPTIIIVHTV